MLIVLTSEYRPSWRWSCVSCV